MCGRFTNAVPYEVLSGRINAELRQVAYYSGPRYNIAPSQPIACLRAPEEGAWEVAMLRWGLVPAWAKDLNIGYKLINARSESVPDKPSFRAAFKRRRCLVPADGWYEWQGEKGAKQAYHIHFADRQPFCFAGLWETWIDRENPSTDPIESGTIITTDACEDTQHIHDRMPVILSPDDYEVWLDPEFEDAAHLQSLLAPWQGEPLESTAVSSYVNNVRNEGPECIEPARKQHDLF